MKKKTVKLFLDPLCAWCWGQKPTIDKLIKELDGKADIELFMGGMRVGNNIKKIEGEYKQYLTKVFDRVSLLSGQTLNKKVLDTYELYFDSEYACRSVILIKQLLGVNEALKYLHKIQSAYFIDSINITQPKVLTEIACDGFVEDSDAFLTLLMSQKNKTSSFEEFNYVKLQNVNGFPEIQFFENNHIVGRIPGFMSYDSAKSKVQNLLTS